MLRRRPSRTATRGTVPPRRRDHLVADRSSSPSPSTAMTTGKATPPAPAVPSSWASLTVACVRGAGPPWASHDAVADT